MQIRCYRDGDEAELIELWRSCGLLAPQNDPARDIAAKLAYQPELLLIGEQRSRVVASVMAGYEGHRGWINYLAVAPELRGEGHGRRLMQAAESRLRALGCQKINLQVRAANAAVVEFYRRIGFTPDDVVSLGKRLT